MKRYKITDRDLTTVSRWIGNKFTNENYFPTAVISINITASKEFYDLDSKADALNNWCESYLSKAHWHNLKNTIRANRLKMKRKQGKAIDVKRIVVNVDVWEKLDRLANKRNESLNDAILYLLDNTK